MKPFNNAYPAGGELKPYSKPEIVEDRALEVSDPIASIAGWVCVRRPDGSAWWMTESEFKLRKQVGDWHSPGSEQ